MVFPITGPVTSEITEKGPLVTVVIPTRNRCRLLKEALESLFHQTFDCSLYEIIVVDNCSEDETASMVGNLQAASPCRLIYHKMQINRGPAVSRNTGARLAQAEIIAFTDSDCRVDPKWLERGFAAFASDPNVAFVSGPVLDKPEQPVRFFSIGGGALQGENPTYPTANILYRKSHFLHLAGFDESVWIRDTFNTPVECSDSDLAWRAKDAGYSNIFVEDMIVYHEVMVVGPLHWLCQNLRVILVPELIRRHPGFRSKISWWGPFCLRDNLLFYCAIVGLVLSATYGVFFILLMLPFVFRAVTATGFNLSLKRFLLLPATVFFFTLRQMVICGCLIYGSIKARTLVL